MYPLRVASLALVSDSVSTVCLGTPQEKQHLEEVLNQRTAEIQTHMQSLQSYELQLSSLTHSLAKYDAALRQAQDEKVCTCST